MSEQTQVIADIIHNLENKTLGSVDVKKRTDVISYVLATNLATAVPLPSSPVVGLSNYWLLNHMPAVRSALCKVNEIYVIDVAAALELARLVYHFRYRMVFDATAIASNLSTIMASGITAIPETYATSLAGVDMFEVNSAINAIRFTLEN